MRSRRALRLIVVATIVLLTPFAADARERREKQSYGAPQIGPTAPEVLAWGPRVALFPLWVISEYGVRRPVGALVKVAERDQWAEEVEDLFTFGDRRQITIYPSALFDFGLKPSVGFNATWKYFLAEPNTARLDFGTWGPDWIAVRAVDRYDFGHRRSLTFDGSFVRRSDLPFYGIGPQSPANPRFRYQASVVDTGLEYEYHFWRSSAFTSKIGARSLVFGNGSCCGARSVEEGVREGLLAIPPGLGDDYTAIYQRLSLAIDSRRARPYEGSGVRAEAHGEADFAPDSHASTRRSWVKYGASVGGALDITGKQRVLSLSLAADLADPLQGTIPFTDQVTLGGEHLMRGFLINRLIDRSALVGSLEYTWPVWVYLDGVIQTDLGNVFGARFDDFSWGLLRMSGSIGVRSNGERDTGFEILVAAGTDPLENGFHASSFRLVIGSHHGF